MNLINILKRRRAIDIQKDIIHGTKVWTFPLENVAYKPYRVTHEYRPVVRWSGGSEATVTFTPSTSASTKIH